MTCLKPRYRPESEQVSYEGRDRHVQTARHGALGMAVGGGRSNGDERHPIRGAPGKVEAGGRTNRINLTQDIFIYLIMCCNVLFVLFFFGI